MLIFRQLFNPRPSTYTYLLGDDQSHENQRRELPPRRGRVNGQLRKTLFHVVDDNRCVLPDIIFRRLQYRDVLHPGFF